jgi:Putative methyltransferase
MFGSLFEDAQRKRKEAPRSAAVADDVESNRYGSKKSKRSKRVQRDEQRPPDAPAAHLTGRKRERPSPQALEFSAKLKDLARQKKMDGVVALYWNPHYDAIRDEHHACIVIDCCARCGDVTTAETIVAKLQQVVSSSPSNQSTKQRRNGDACTTTMNVETQTALLKVYVHAGKIYEAMQLFRRISNPNVRTLNTLLRGCLWTAATRVESSTIVAKPIPVRREIAGGVVTSEEAWMVYQGAFPNANQTLDVSSYEYSIVLLCQALRVREAEDRTSTFCLIFQIRVKGKASVSGGDQAALETLAVIYLALARAYALLDQADNLWRSCQRCLSAIKTSRSLLLAESPSVDAGGTSDVDKAKTAQRGASGGKRGWKSNSAVTEANSSSDRNTSNIVFRTHRLSELEADVLVLLKRNRNSVAPSRSEMAARIRNRLLYFCGGAATTEYKTSKNPTASTTVGKRSRLSVSNFEKDRLVSSWHSFGLSQFGSQEQETASTELTSAQISSFCGLPDSQVVSDDGKIDFRLVFPFSERPLDIEIGAGFGSWIVQQAEQNDRRNYVAVELRADRCLQIFSRATLEAESRLDNIAVVGSECCGFLRDRINQSSVATVYANFPEPPTQTYGNDPGVLTQITDGRMKEPSHMLHSQTILAIGKSLQRGGKTIIVTDNRSYGRLLAATFAKIVRENKGLLQSVPPGELRDASSLRRLEVFANVVDIYEQSGGDKGNSYFDRLWRTGVGRRSEKNTRFVIVMKRL